jgi:uncharacterized protein YecA (UPF0149 family)
MGFLNNIAAFFSKKEDDMPTARPGRNELCWCGSGKKYKKCHLPQDEEKMSKKWSANCGPT